MIDKEEKGSEMHDEVKECCFKALISAAKYNVSTEALSDLCKEWVDEYYVCNFPLTYDAVSLASGHLLKTLLFRIRQILSGDG